MARGNAMARPGGRLVPMGRVPKGLVALAILVAAGCGRAAPGGLVFPRASLLLISVDTLRADHLGCYGYGRPTSPGIDALADEGVVFEEAFSQCTWTTPSHAALLTSRYPTELGLRPWPDPGRIPDRFPTLAEVLRGGGFRTRAVTESGWMNGKFGFARGFEDYDDRGGHLRRIVPRAEALLGELAGARFFLFLHTYDVHWYAPPPRLEREFCGDYSGPLRPSDALRQGIQGHDNAAWLAALAPADRRYLSDLYDAEIRNVDEYVTRLVDEMKRRGLWERTLFVLTSDHGEEFFERGRTGHGYSARDEQTHVPLVMRLPGGALGGRRVRAQARSIDVMPTVLDLLGIPGPWPEMRGASLRPLLEGRREGGERPAFTDRGHVPRVAIRQGGWKVVRDLRAGRIWMYDLAQDPGETEDRFGASPPPGGTRALESLDGWLKGLGPEGGAPPAPPAPSPPLTPAERKGLRALGYLEGGARVGRGGGLVLVIGDAALVEASRLARDLERRGAATQELLSPSPERDPSLAALLTGTLPFRSGVRRDGDPLRPGVETLSGILARAGFDTRLVPGGDPPAPVPAWLARAFQGSGGGRSYRLVLCPRGGGAGGVDRAAAGILRDLEGRGLLDEALVALVGLPGGGPGAGRLRERDLRVPVVLRLPRGARGSSGQGEAASLTDLRAVLLEALGVGPPSPPREPPPPGPLYAEWLGEAGMRAALREGRWKLVVWFDRSLHPRERFLRDLAADPEERGDVLREHPGIAGGIGARLDRLLEGDPSPGRTLARLRARYRFASDGILPDPAAVPSPVLLPRRPGVSLGRARLERAAVLLARFAGDSDPAALRELEGLGVARDRAIEEALAGDSAELVRGALAAVRAMRLTGAFPAVLDAFLARSGPGREGEREGVGGGAGGAAEILGTLVALDRDRLGRELRAHARDPRARARRSVAYGLRALLTPGELPLLLALLGDPDPGVRAAAADTLAGVRGEGETRRVVGALLESLEGTARDAGALDAGREAARACIRALRDLAPEARTEGGEGGPGPGEILASPASLRSWIEDVRKRWTGGGRWEGAGG